MKYLIIFFVLVGFAITLSVNNIYAIPRIDSQRIYDNSDVILLGKVISVNSTFSPTYNLYEIQAEKFLKNPQNSDIVFVAGQKTVYSRAGNSVFSVNDRVLFFLSNDTMKYDQYSEIFRISSLHLAEPEWDKCNIFEKEIPREHWFLGGVGIDPKIQQGTNSDIENFKKDKLVTVTYDVSNLSDSAQEFDLDGTILVSNGTSFETMSTMNQHIILEPCTIYKTIDWRFTPDMSGFYNFEIKDPRSGSYGLGFTVVDNDLVESPLKQFKSGIKPKDIRCNEGLQLVMKNWKGNWVCVKNSSVEKLTLRNYIYHSFGSSGVEIQSDKIETWKKYVDPNPQPEIILNETKSDSGTPHVIHVIDNEEMKLMIEFFQSRYHTSMITYSGPYVILNATNVWGETISLVMQPLDDRITATLTCNHNDWRKQEIITENVLAHLQNKNCFAPTLEETMHKNNAEPGPDYDSNKYDTVFDDGSPIQSKKTGETVLDADNCKRYAYWLTKYQKEKIDVSEDYPRYPPWGNEIFPLVDYCLANGNLIKTIQEDKIHWEFQLENEN